MSGDLFLYFISILIEDDTVEMKNPWKIMEIVSSRGDIKSAYYFYPAKKVWQSKSFLKSRRLWVFKG